jgi:uncharacterized membrane protein
MSWVHLHLLLNHVPLLGAAFATFLLAFAMLKGSDELKKVSLGASVIAALIAIPVYLTGEPAEEAVEKLPGVSEAIIGRHEAAALVALIMVLVLGVVAIAGLVFFRRNRRIPLWFGTVALLLSLVACGAMGWTANLGGQVRHSEIRYGATSAPTSNESQKDADKRGAKDDDDYK